MYLDLTCNGYSAVMACRQEVVKLNSIIVTEGQANLAQQKAVWAAQKQLLVAQWEQQRLNLQIQSEQAHLEEMHLMHLPYDSPYRNAGIVRIPLMLRSAHMAQLAT